MHQLFFFNAINLLLPWLPLDGSAEGLVVGVASRLLPEASHCASIDFAFSRWVAFIYKRKDFLRITIISYLASRLRQSFSNCTKRTTCGLNCHRIQRHSVQGGLGAGRDASSAPSAVLARSRCWSRRRGCCIDRDSPGPQLSARVALRRLKGAYFGKSVNYEFS